MFTFWAAGFSAGRRARLGIFPKTFLWQGDNMANTHIHVRIDYDTKKQAQQILGDMGLDITTAVNMFIKQVVRNRSFPFLPSTDPFYSESNMAHLMSVKTDADVGINMAVHDLIED